jgi:hypothetical protein
MVKTGITDLPCSAQEPVSKRRVRMDSLPVKEATGLAAVVPADPS